MEPDRPWRILRRLETLERLGVPPRGLQCDAQLELALTITGVETDCQAQLLVRCSDVVRPRRLG